MAQAATQATQLTTPPTKVPTAIVLLRMLLGTAAAAEEAPVVRTDNSTSHNLVS
jgi:hypothetical protein